MTAVSDRDRMKHLEFLQAVIGRMGNTSFLIKGWVVTITTALLVVSADRRSWAVAASALVPIVVFWCVDGYYLHQERLFRRLYDAVRQGDGTLEPLSMDPARYRPQITWAAAAGSVTLVAFYGTVMVVDLAFVAMAALSVSPVRP